MGAHLQIMRHVLHTNWMLQGPQFVPVGLWMDAFNKWYNFGVLMKIFKFTNMKKAKGLGSSCIEQMLQ